MIFSTLLAFSSHSFAQNQVTNPGFENGTNGWTLEDDASAQYTESSGRSGARLTHWSSSASYRAETKQTVTGLSAGTYRLSAYTVGGETSGAWLWAYCDGRSYSTPIPPAGWGDWTEVAVEGIQVNGSSCQIGITTEDSEWSSFDDVVFERVADDGNPPDDGEIFRPSYIIGADITWVLEHESIGRTFSHNGQTKPYEQILADHGFNFIRIRTFVCPECPGGYLDNLYSGAGPTENWGDTAHTIELAQRVKALDMGIFLNFHLSDNWASIGHQERPSHWQGMNLAQMRTASYNHAKDVLDQMVAAGVKPDMVQCGNEVNTRVSGYSFNDWAGYSGIINSCMQAVRDTDPDIVTVLQHGRPRPDGNFPDWLNRVSGNNPPIDTDVVCGSTYGTTNNGQDWWDMFNLVINDWGKPVMSCEYSDNRRDLVNDTFRNLPNNMGLGTFLWEPHAWGDRKLFWLDGNVYRTTDSISAYISIAQEEGLPVPFRR